MGKFIILQDFMEKKDKSIVQNQLMLQVVCQLSILLG